MKIILTLLFLMSSLSAQEMQSMPTLAGTPYALSLSGDRPTLLVFWGSWCMPCRKEAPRLVKLHAELQGHIRMLGVSVDGQKHLAQEFVDTYTIPYPTLLDPQLSLADMLQVKETPKLLLFDAAGKRVITTDTLNKDLIVAMKKELMKHKEQVRQEPQDQPHTQILSLTENVDIIEQETISMGTDIHISIASEHREEAGLAIQQAFAEIDRIDDLMTDWRSVGDIYRINKSAGMLAVRVSDEVIQLIRAAHNISVATDGLFDISYKPAGALWNFTSDVPVIPSTDRIVQAVSYINYQDILIEGQTVLLAWPQMKIGLGGIAKGYAVDRAVEIIKKHGFENFVVNAGGDLFVHGNKESPLWRVAIKHPRQADSFIAELPVKNYAVVSSGDYERFFIKEGKRYCHIINPKTGYPGTLCQSVTIMAVQAQQADALATAVFLLGPVKGLALVETYPEVEALIIDSNGVAHLSSGFHGQKK